MVVIPLLLPSLPRQFLVVGNDNVALRASHEIVHDARIRDQICLVIYEPWACPLPAAGRTHKRPEVHLLVCTPRGHHRKSCLPGIGDLT